MSTSKRIISLLLALVMVLGMLPWDALGVEAAGLVETVRLSLESDEISGADLAAVAESNSNPTETTEPGDGVEVTRAQWVQELVNTFSMTVEEDNYPDNYFGDLTGDEEYYRDILVAVEFGVIDLETGLPFEPEAAATREFCAHTLNFCLGYQLNEDSEYTFTESQTAEYPDDIQIAINRDWFVLENGAFLPELAVTAEEKNSMLQDAAAVLASDEIDPDYQNSYEFTEDVIELSEQTAVYWESEEQISLLDPDYAIQKGDVFAVYEDGFPLVCKAENVTKTGNLHTVTITSLNINDYLVSIDAQGTSVTDLAEFEPAEDVDAIYILEDGSEVYSVQDAGTREIKSICLAKEFKGYKVYIEVYDMVLNWHSKGGLFNDLDTSAVVTGRAYFDVSIPFGASVSDFSDVLTLGTVPIGPFGRISVTADLSIDGSVSFDYGTKFSVGISYNGRDGFRIPMTFEKTRFSMCVEANVKAGISVSAGLTGIPLLSASCRATVGLQVNFTARYRGEDSSPKLCIHTDAWLYCSAYASATVGIKKWDSTSKTWSGSVVIWDRNHSPVRSSSHFEDGTLVSKCTRGDFSSVRYYSSGSSRYANGGVSAVSNSPHYTYTVDEDGNATITGFSGNASSISIPVTIDGHPVTVIGSNVFAGKTSLYSVTLPNGVVSIGKKAFKGCAGLRDIRLPNTLHTIGDNAFENCSSLTTITIPNGIASIAPHTFSGCKSLQRISLPDSVTRIGNYAFSNSGLTSLNLPAHVETLGAQILQGNTRVTEITIPKTVTTMHYNTSGNKGSLYDSAVTKIVFEDGITTIPAYAAHGTWNLTEVVIPTSVTVISNNAFDNCQSLTQIQIPDNVTQIGNYAFIHSGLTSLQLPPCLEVLGAQILVGNTGVTEITIPKTVTTMHYNTSGNKGSLYDSAVTKVVFEDGITRIPDYALHGAWKLIDVDIPDSVTIIARNSFDNCKSLTQVHIPDSVTQIGNYAFEYSGLTSLQLPPCLEVLGAQILVGNTGVTEITIPKTVTTMHYNTSGNKGSLYDSAVTKVVFEDGITRIPAYAAHGARVLTEVTIPDSVTTISKHAFDGVAFTEFTIPNHITSTGSNLFANCNSLIIVTWPSSLPMIPEYAFSGCTSLTTVNLPGNLTEIHRYAFNNCDSLVTFTVPDSVTTMNENAFYDCDALQEIHLAEKLQKINNNTFYDCDALNSITIPYGVTSIGSSAFYDCDALETVDMANSVTSLGSSAFKHCDVLKNVKLSRNLTAIPSEAFRECAELEEIVIPYFTTKIDSNAFNSSPQLKKVVTHEKLAAINTSAFSYADRTVFYGPTGSYTNTWCTENGYSFVENTAATTRVTAAESSVTIPKSKTYMLDFDIDPIDFHEIITTKSSNTAVATVDETGKITAVAPGTATIKIIVGGASASCKVTVTQAVTKITLNKTKLSLDVPETYQLTATITPADASNKALNWTSSNPAAATVDANGLVTAVGNGTTVIKAEAADGTGISASCTVTVIDPSKIPVSSITLDKSALSLEAMETYQLTASVSPANAANKALIWTSSNEAVATVDSNGQVTAVAKGTATITATAADGYGASANCTVTVTNNGYVVTALDQFQSSHPYGNSCTDFWQYTQPGAGSVSITFDAETEMEDGFDYLYIYGGEGNLIGKYTGTELANQTITIPGDTVKVQIESDDSGNAWGFRVTDVDYTDHTHSFTNYVSDGNATCTEDGTKTARCDYCDATDTIPDAGSALGHDMGSWETTVPATCTENGEEQRTCSRCDHSESRVIEAVGHRWDKGVVTREPTEDTEGERLYTCTSCGATRMESIPVIGHEHRYEAVVTAPTCTERGYTTYTCKCGESYVADYVDALGHSFGEWIVIQEPTTTEDGLEERSCSRCGHIEQRTVAKLENPFSDVAPGSFYYEPVMWAVENGITNGTSATTFGPNDQCMRAHVVTFLWRAVGSPEPTRTDNPFVDVKPGDFYYKSVLWALENGITSGMDATHFGPTSYCNRAQVVTFLYRTMGSPALESMDNPFTDVQAGAFYEKPVLWAVQNGITNGLSATSFGPGSICNRAQIVTFLYRAFVD